MLLAACVCSDELRTHCCHPDAHQLYMWEGKNVSCVFDFVHVGILGLTGATRMCMQRGPVAHSRRMYEDLVRPQV